MSVPMTLSDLERRDAKGQIFLTDLHNYAHGLTSSYPLGVMTNVEEQCVSRGSATPPSTLHEKPRTNYTW